MYLFIIENDRIVEIRVSNEILDMKNTVINGVRSMMSLIEYVEQNLYVITLE